MDEKGSRFQFPSCLLEACCITLNPHTLQTCTQLASVCDFQNVTCKLTILIRIRFQFPFN